MPLTLSDLDLSRLHAAQTVLVSSLEYAHADEWRAAVNHHLGELVEADRVVSALPSGDGVSMYSDQFTPGELDEQAHMLATDGGTERVRALGLEVWNHTLLIQPDPGLFYDSPVYHDYYRPNRLEDGIGYAVEVADGEFGILKLHQSRRGCPGFGERGLALLRLLLPAYKAGVQTCLRLSGERERLASELDLLAEGLLVCDTRGMIMHANTALSQMLLGDPEQERVWAEMQEVTYALVRLISPDMKSQRMSTVQAVMQEVRTRAATYRVRGSLAGEGLFTREPALLIALERLTTALPSEEAIRQQWGLTRAQARVARLMAQGRGNPEIATELSVSPHTVRRHAEVVRMKLGVHSRAEVASKILRG